MNQLYSLPMTSSDLFRFAKVGGSVRDQLMGLEPQDVDFVSVPQVEFATAEEAMRALRKDLEASGYVLLKASPQFFCLKVRSPDSSVVDFVMARKDGPSSDGRRPDYVLPGTLHDDLARRDFTINAMAIMDGELVDPFGGENDLHRRTLRFVGDPMQRISEDGLRVMRAFRFMVTKGLDPDEATISALFSSFAAEMLMKVNVDRIRKEVEKMFLANMRETFEIFSSTYMPIHIYNAIFRDNLRVIPTLKK